MNDEIYEKRLDPTNEAEPYIKIDFGTIEPDNPRLVTCINCNKTETLETYSQAQQWLKTHEHHNVGIQADTTDAATYLGPDGETTLPDNWKPGPYKP